IHQPASFAVCALADRGISAKASASNKPAERLARFNTVTSWRLSRQWSDQQHPTFKRTCLRVPPKLSVQPKHAIDRLEIRRLDQARMRDDDRVQRPLELLLPEGEKLLQLRKFRKQIVVLPDIALQQPLLIGPAVNDLRRRQAVTLE